MSYNTLTRPHITFVQNALTAVGATFPKGVIKAIADQEKIIAAAREFIPATRDQVHEAVAQCLLEGGDPATDERVRRMVTLQALGEGGVIRQGINLTAQATERTVDAISEHLDEILADLAAPAEEAGDRLSTAYDLLGDEESPQNIMSKGLEAVEAWTHRRKAEELLRTIDKAWVALANLTAFTVPPGDPVLRLCDANLTTFEKAGRRAKPWDIIRAGGRISLADRTTYPERVQRINDAQQAREGQQARQLSEGYRRTHGVKASA